MQCATPSAKSGFAGNATWWKYLSSMDRFCLNPLVGIECVNKGVAGRRFSRDVALAWPVFLLLLQRTHAWVQI